MSESPTPSEQDAVPGPPTAASGVDPARARRARRLALSTGLVVAATVCLAWTTLSAWGLLGTDIGQGHSRLLRVVAPLALLVTVLLARRRAENDAGISHFVVTVLLAGATAFLAARQVAERLSDAVPCRHESTAAVTAGLAVPVLVAAMVTGPGASWFVPVGNRQRNRSAIARGGAVGVALLLLAMAGGWVTEHLSIDATHTSAAARSAPASVHATAWTVPYFSSASGVVPTVLGPALYGDNLQVLDGRTGRELWHYRHRGVRGDDEPSGIRLQASPNGRHLVLVESMWADGGPVTIATAFSANGHVAGGASSVGGTAPGEATDEAPDAWGDAVVLDDYWAFVDRHGLTARDWSGRQLWHRDVPDGCRHLLPVTHATFLLRQGCHGTHLQQFDAHGGIVWQGQLPENTSLGTPVSAPDWSATAFVENNMPFDGPSFVRPQLLLGDHGERSLAACGKDDCVPGPRLQLWRTTHDKRDDAFATVYDAQGHVVRRTRLDTLCIERPVATGAATLCDGAPVLGPYQVDDQVLATRVQLPGSSMMSFHDTPHILALWNAGGSVVVLACNEKDEACRLRGLR